MALGRLNHSYTDVEVMLAEAIATLLALGTESRKHANMILAVTSTGRMKHLKDTTNRILKAGQATQEQFERIKPVFAHLGEIQFLRDKLAHNETHLVKGSDPPVFENRPPMSDADGHSIVFAASALDAAADDLEEIFPFIALLFEDQLLLLGRPIVPPPKPFELEPWLYKPAMLTRCRRKSDGSHLARFCPPPASEA